MEPEGILSRWFYFTIQLLLSSSVAFFSPESPNDIIIQRVGDAEGKDSSIIAAAGEEIELECIVTGGNPPAKLRWFTRDQEIQSGHRQDNTRASSSGNSRTWVSISRLSLPVSKADNRATVKCLAEHPTLLQKPLEAKANLTIHCKWILYFAYTHTLTRDAAAAAFLLTSAMTTAS